MGIAEARQGAQGELYGRQPRFDSKNVGYDTENSPFKSGSFVVDPANGNGNGGHEYGTALSEEERWAIVEYMKTL